MVSHNIPAGFHMPRFPPVTRLDLLAIDALQTGYSFALIDPGI